MVVQMAALVTKTGVDPLNKPAPPESLLSTSVPPKKGLSALEIKVYKSLFFFFSNFSEIT